MSKSQIVRQLLVALFIATESEFHKIVNDVDLALCKIPESLEKDMILRLRKIVGRRSEDRTEQGFLQGDALFVRAMFDHFCQLSKESFWCKGQELIDNFNKKAFFAAVEYVYANKEKSERISQDTEHAMIFDYYAFYSLPCSDVFKATNETELRACGWGSIDCSKRRGYVKVAESGKNLFWHNSLTSSRRGCVSIDWHSTCTTYFTKEYFKVNTSEFELFRSAQIGNWKNQNNSHVLNAARNLIKYVLRLVQKNEE